MKIQKFAKDEKGAVLPLVALFIFFVALGIVALVVDVGMMYTERRSMVAAADAGALAGAIEMQKWGSSKAEIEQIAEDAARFNGAEGVVEATAYMGVDSINEMKVVVEVKNTVDLFFAKMFNINTADVPARAVAKPMRLNPNILPIGIDETKAYVDGKPGGGLIYLHGDKTDPAFFSDLLNLDGKSGGASKIQEIISNRYYELGPGFATTLASESSIDAAGGWKNLNGVIEELLEEAYDFSSDEDLRKAYMTALAPVYIEVASKKAVIQEFAEIVIVDKFSPMNKNDINKGVSVAFPITQSGATVIVDYSTTVGSTPNTFPKMEMSNNADVVVAYFTGVTVSVEDLLNGNYQGTIYNQVKLDQVSLIE